MEFEDGSEITLKRENIWSEQEELPKRVKSRIVCVYHSSGSVRSLFKGVVQNLNSQTLFEIRLSRDC